VSEEGELKTSAPLLGKKGKDGWAQPAPWKCDTLNVAPGERWDVIVNCNNQQWLSRAVS
jgi:hypothetical protein